MSSIMFELEILICAQLLSVINRIRAQNPVSYSTVLSTSSKERSS